MFLRLSEVKQLTRDCTQRIEQAMRKYDLAHRRMCAQVALASSSSSQKLNNVSDDDIIVAGVEATSDQEVDVTHAGHHRRAKRHVSDVSSGDNTLDNELRVAAATASRARSKAYSPVGNGNSISNAIDEDDADDDEVEDDEEEEDDDDDDEEDDEDADIVMDGDEYTNDVLARPRAHSSDRWLLDHLNGSHQRQRAPPASRNASVKAVAVEMSTTTTTTTNTPATRASMRIANKAPANFGVRQQPTQRRSRTSSSNNRLQLQQQQQQRQCLCPPGELRARVQTLL